MIRDKGFEPCAGKKCTVVCLLKRGGRKEERGDKESESKNEKGKERQRREGRKERWP